MSLTPAADTHAPEPPPHAAVAHVPDASPPARDFVVELRIDLRHAGPRHVVVRGAWTGPADAPVVVVAGGISANRHVAPSGAVHAATESIS